MSLSSVELPAVGTGETKRSKNRTRFARNITSSAAVGNVEERETPLDKHRGQIKSYCYVMREGVISYYA